MEIKVKATSDLAGLVPKSGKMVLDEGARVQDLLNLLGVNPEAVMLVVIDKRIADIDAVLKDGATVELIPPISGG